VKESNESVTEHEKTAGETVQNSVVGVSNGEGKCKQEIEGYVGTRG
jgi:hypothetical protein